MQFRAETTKLPDIASRTCWIAQMRKGKDGAY